MGDTLQIIFSAMSHFIYILEKAFFTSISCSTCSPQTSARPVLNSIKALNNNCYNAYYTVFIDSQYYTIAKFFHLTRAPLGSGDQRAPWGGGILAPQISREPRNVATSGKRCWIALVVNSLKHINFSKIEVTGQVKLRSNAKSCCF